MNNYKVFFKGIATVYSNSLFNQSFVQYNNNLNIVQKNNTQSTIVFGFKQNKRPKSYNELVCMLKGRNISNIKKQNKREKIVVYNGVSYRIVSTIL